MQSNRVGDGTDDCEMAGQRVQQPMITSLSMSATAIKGNGSSHSNWFNLCSIQNAPMTNWESKYSPFCVVRLTLRQHYPPFKWLNGLGHTLNAAGPFTFSQARLQFLLGENKTHTALFPQRSVSPVSLVVPAWCMDCCLRMSACVCVCVCVCVRGSDTFYCVFINCVSFTMWHPYCVLCVCSEVLWWMYCSWPVVEDVLFYNAVQLTLFRGCWALRR